MKGGKGEGKKGGRAKRKERRKRERDGTFQKSPNDALTAGCLGTSHRNQCHVPLQNFQ